MSTDLVAQPSPLNALLADPDKLRDFPIATVERMFAMEKEIMAEAARKAFNDSFRGVQTAMTPVVRRGKIDYGKGQPPSLFAKAEHVAGMLDPLLALHGFSRSVSETDCGKDKMSRFTLTLRHGGGHVERHHLDVPVGSGKGGSMNSMQAMASTYTYCERHLLCKVFGVHLTDDDDGHAGGGGEERITDRQASELQEMLDEAGGQAAFLKVFSRGGQPLSGVRELHPAAHKAALTMLRSKLRRAK